MTTPIQSTLSAGLGPWAHRLTPELLHNVLLRMDMLSLFRPRHTNLAWMRMVDSLQPFQLCVSYAMTMFAALLRTKTAHRVSLLDFHDVLINPNNRCVLYDSFGLYVFIPSWERCCGTCLAHSYGPRLDVRALPTVHKTYGLQTAVTLQLFQLKTIPGDYALDPNERSTRGHNSSTIIVSAQQVNQLFGRIPPRNPCRPHRSALDKGKTACTLPYYDQRLDQVSFGLYCDGCRLNCDDKKYIGVDIVETLHSGEKSYTRIALLEYFQWCQKAQYLWNESLKGKKLHLPILSRATLYNCQGTH